MSSYFYTEELERKLIHYSLRKAETQEYISLGSLLDFTRRVLGVKLSHKQARNIKRWIDRTLMNSTYFYKIKMDGIIWYTTTAAGRRAYLDLIRGRLAPKQNSNSLENSGFQSYRNRAEQIIQDNLFLRAQEYDELEDLLSEYLSLIEYKVIVLRNKREKEQLMLLGYKTRFNDGKRRSKLLARYDRAWSYATQHYKDGVFLTLTTDLHRFSSIYEATMSMSWAFNSFMSWLQKKLGYRPPYIKVLEFTKKGLPHLHIIFFNVSYLADKEEITQEWNRLGQGIINYVYAIVNRNGHWRWKARRPQGGGHSVKNYLKKYLLKTMSDTALGTLALYWATNRRFYTTARVLGKKLKKLRKIEGDWEFFMSMSILTVFDELPWWADIVYSEFGGGDG